MTSRLHRFGALFVLACALPMANAQPTFHRSREAQRLENYAQDVLRNNRRECRDLRQVRQHPNGQVHVECLSNNQRRELRYVISPAREDRRGGRATSASVRRIGEKVRAGDVLLAHINHPERQNGAHVVELLEHLRAKGFSFVSWSQAQANGVRVQTVTPRSIRLDRD